MAKVDVSFNFGANVRPKKKAKSAKKGKSAKSDAWQSYTGGKRRR